jgi:hypothetical protein
MEEHQRQKYTKTYLRLLSKIDIYLYDMLAFETKEYICDISMMSCSHQASKEQIH